MYKIMKTKKPNL